MRRRRDGILIAGGGLAGCLAALALARHRPDVPFMIVEESGRFGGERLRTVFEDGLDEEGRTLLDGLAAHRWGGFYVALPGLGRKLKAPMAGIEADALHEAMIAALKPDQYRLGARIVAVREDALELDGGEALHAQAAIDARGAANLSLLELLWESRFERACRLAAPHRLDRPVLIDATFETSGARFVQCVPTGADRLVLSEVALSDSIHSEIGAAGRLDAYAQARGWTIAEVESEREGAQPLPYGGDFDAFWRLGGARVARLGLRGGFLHPATGRTAADALRTAMLLTRQRDFSAGALYDAFEEEAKTLWRRREPWRELNRAIAKAGPEARRARLERLYRLDAPLVARFHADTLGMIDRMRVQRALRGG